MMSFVSTALTSRLDQLPIKVQGHGISCKKKIPLYITLEDFFLIAHISSNYYSISLSVHLYFYLSLFY